jgi:hypothetical protein
MMDRTLRGLAVLALLAIAACTELATQTSSVEPPLPDIGGWRMSSGKLPTKAEFAALAATCQAKGGAVDACLAELGLKHVP